MAEKSTWAKTIHRTPRRARLAIVKDRWDASDSFENIDVSLQGQRKFMFKNGFCSWSDTSLRMEIQYTTDGEF
jgi:hypothetical protein